MSSWGHRLLGILVLFFTPEMCQFFWLRVVGLLEWVDRPSKQPAGNAAGGNRQAIRADVVPSHAVTGFADGSTAAAAEASGDMEPGSFSFLLAASSQVGSVWFVSYLRVNSEHSIRVACTRFHHCEVSVLYVIIILGSWGRDFPNLLSNFFSIY